jgi:predicted transglutaminase-like protease
MKRLPLGISYFKKIIEKDYLYIDKTKKIHTVLNQAKYLFLSRPSRFGKSLLISTLKELFLSNKELFSST